MASGIPNADEFLKAFHIDLVDATRQDVIDLQTVLTIDVCTELVRNTPVDRGRARGNWLTSAGSPREDELITPDKTGDGAVARAHSVVATLNPFEPFQPTFITNNLPYIEVLDQGLFVPPDPPEDEKSRQRRKWSRSKAKRREAKNYPGLGHEGATYVRGGYSIKAPLGILDISLANVELKHGSSDA